MSPSKSSSSLKNKNQGRKNMQEEKILFNATLCFPVRGDEILLGRKMKKIGQGCWNGYGGGIENGETPEQSMLRELREEAGVTAEADALEKVAVMCFHNTKADGGFFVCKVHIYFLHKWEGDFQTTDEINNPTWFKKKRLPLKEMMLADREWLPAVLSGKKIIGEAKYGPLQKTLLGKVDFQFVTSFVDN
jgi:ADP-ribose pyrophosphatase